MAIGTGTSSTSVLVYEDNYLFGPIFSGRSWNAATADDRLRYGVVHKISSEE